MRRRVVLAGLLAGVPLGASGCRSDETALPPVVIATGGRGGVYHALGEAFAATLHDRWKVRATVLTTAASIENLRLLAAGRADLAFSTVDSADLAARGAGPFATPFPGGGVDGRVAALSGLYDDYLHVVVRADSPIRRVADLRGRRVSTGAAGSGTEVVAGRVLAAAGLRGPDAIVRSRLSASGSGDALRAGRIDAFFFTGGLPTPAVADLARTVRVRLLPVGALVTGLQRSFGEVYLARSIPAGTYGMGREVPTLAIPNVLVVRADMPSAVARELTALLFASKARLAAVHAQARRLDRRAALATYPLPLHPGAARYFRETKVWAASGP
ncbi:TAXI family TRAP transporter solute-binding subunit [Actinomadura oligospora]|uniref:TAXI family TRAP transporter solute-binding subunit n=1 Tax=Actinomadura oligospora TaxID=111804 RepID=UPI0004BC87E3|nr:TAXI family TRAP transporter solute-binding subunit [Actinomadura oligospora]